MSDRIATEVGLLPRAWQVLPLGRVTKAMRLGGNYKNSERVSDWPLIKMGNIGRGNINLDKIEFVDAAQPPLEEHRLRPGDVLFNTRNTLDLVGKVAMWGGELPTAYYNSNILCFVFDESIVGSAEFMNAALNTSASLRLLKGMAIGTTSVAAIYTRDLVHLPVPLPSRREQCAIAEALSDADGLVQSLERLITKKRQIKLGAMQELLTGKRRLPGFGGPWQRQQLADICLKIQDGTHFSPKVGGGEFLYITSQNIRRGHLDLTDAATIDAAQHASIYRRCDVQQGDLLITKDGASTGNAAINTLTEPFSLLSSVAFLRICADDASGEFILQQILSDAGQRQIQQAMAGNAITRLTLQKIRDLTVSCPPVREQEAIATVLSHMDAELAALEAKLTKARRIKQGMMQQLLTGRIRLPVKETSREEVPA